MEPIKKLDADTLKVYDDKLPDQILNISRTITSKLNEVIERINLLAEDDNNRE